MKYIVDIARTKPDGTRVVYTGSVSTEDGAPAPPPPSPPDTKTTEPYDWRQGTRGARIFKLDMPSDFFSGVPVVSNIHFRMNHSAWIRTDGRTMMTRFPGLKDVKHSALAIGATYRDAGEPLMTVVKEDKVTMWEYTQRENHVTEIEKAVMETALKDWLNPVTAGSVFGDAFTVLKVYLRGWMAPISFSYGHFSRKVDMIVVTSMHDDSTVSEIIVPEKKWVAIQWQPAPPVK